MVDDSQSLKKINRITYKEEALKKKDECLTFYQTNQRQTENIDPFMLNREWIVRLGIVEM